MKSTLKCYFVYHVVDFFHPALTLKNWWNWNSLECLKVLVINISNYLPIYSFALWWEKWQTQNTPIIFLNNLAFFFICLHALEGYTLCLAHNYSYIILSNVKMFKITLNSPIKCNITATTIIQREEGHISANEISFSILPKTRFNLLFCINVCILYDK